MYFDLRGYTQGLHPVCAQRSLSETAAGVYIGGNPLMWGASTAMVALACGCEHFAYKALCI